MMQLITFVQLSLDYYRDEKTDVETSDLNAMLLTDVLYNYSYNEKYLSIIKVIQYVKFDV